ncbi:MAG TPA: A/G-specific adenine glycosylase [Ideonella sp.]|nr:A/G-specific adenine glycosylase [Ideonella sp.]
MSAAHAGFARRLVDWQRGHGRHDLPWQGTRDPYRVWLSEIMLQQTQVATVLGYYGRFLARFPDVHALAAASLDEVLVQWQGLGYYSRARNLHRCARVVVERHGGAFPASSAELAELPGIGRSTAAAIAAFCFGERVAILDGNVKRVLTRLLGIDADLALAANERALWDEAAALLPRTGIEAYTQGLMDLGATLCRARAPDCAACPVRSLCAAARAGDPERYPMRTRRGVRTRRESWLLWLHSRGRVWLVQRPPRGVWAGLWTPPIFDDEPALLCAAAALGVAPAAQPPIDHALTHFDWRLHPRRATLPRAGAAPGPGRWVAHADLGAVALPAPLARLLGG